MRRPTTRWPTSTRRVATCTGYTLLIVGASSAVPGDANLDGYVNETDAAVLAGNWGQGGDWRQGDFDHDFIVGPRDASIMAANWGYGTEESGESSAMPEPGVLVTLLGMAGLALLWRRRRKL